MAGKRHTPEQVVRKLREAEVAIAGGSTVAEAARRIGVTEQTFYLWRSDCGRLRIDQAGRLKRLESENSRLKRPNVGQPDSEGGAWGPLACRPCPRACRTNITGGTNVGGRSLEVA